MRLLLWFLFLCLPLLASATEQKAASWRSVWLGAGQLPAELEKLPLDALSLASWKTDHFEAIPFQIDQLNQLGLVYFQGQLAALKGSAGHFDADDQLGFMWRDASAKAPEGAKPVEGKVVARIALSLPAGGEQRYVYLLADNPKRSAVGYISQDFDTGVTVTPRYALEVSPNNELDWRSFQFRQYEGKGSIISALRMRMAGHMLTRLAPRITLQNDNLRPELLAHKSGPIRSVMLLQIDVVLLGIPVMTIYEQVCRYPARYQATTYARIPAFYRISLKEPHVAVSFVGNHQLGATIQSALGGGRQGVVDGRLSMDEQQLRRLGIDAAHNWVYFNSHKNFVMVTHLSLPRSLLDVPVELVYADRTKREDASALLPNVGYAINAWPDEDVLSFSLELLFDNSLHGLPPEDYLKARLAPVEVEIDG